MHELTLQYLYDKILHDDNKCIEELTETIRQFIIEEFRCKYWKEEESDD